MNSLGGLDTALMRFQFQYGTIKWFSGIGGFDLAAEVSIPIWYD